MDLRPLLRRLESGKYVESTWHELWQELYHQGDVGEGSFLAFPHLVRIHKQRGTGDWNTYAVAATTNWRDADTNPDVPDWARDSYQASLTEQARLGLAELPRASEPETVRSILALLAIVHGARVYSRILAEFSEDEVLELEKAAFCDSR